jgi:hypothetical protein
MSVKRKVTNPLGSAASAIVDSSTTDFVRPEELRGFLLAGLDNRVDGV